MVAFDSRPQHLSFLDENAAKIRAALTGDWQTATQIAKGARLTQPMASRILGHMIDAKNSGVEIKFEEVAPNSAKRRYLYRLRPGNDQQPT